MRELTFDEVEFVSGARRRGSVGYNPGRSSYDPFGNFSMSNGGNWGNTLTLTAIGAAAGSYRGGFGGALVWGVAGFLSSFTYTW